MADKIESAALSPPVARAAELVPDGDPEFLYLAVDKSATSVQLDPSHASVLAFAGVPPKSPAKIKAFVLSLPAAPPKVLPLFASLTSVQFVPFQL